MCLALKGFLTTDKSMGGYMIESSGQFFDWDEDKNLLNIEKHGISFSEASTVFEDNNAVFVYDEAHSISEERFIIVGFSGFPRLLMVCHCYRKDGEIIRIISARKATEPEELLYENGGVF